MITTCKERAIEEKVSIGYKASYLILRTFFHLLLGITMLECALIEELRIVRTGKIRSNLIDVWAFELQFNASIRWQTVPAQTVLWLINSHSHESSLLFSGFVQCRWIWLDGRNFICLVFFIISLAVVKQHNKTDKSRDSFFLSKTLSQNYRVSEKKRRTFEREKKTSQIVGVCFELLQRNCRCWKCNYLYVAKQNVEEKPCKPPTIWHESHARALSLSLACSLARLLVIAKAWENN